MYQNLLSIAQKMRLPSICVLCHQYHVKAIAVCDACIALLPMIHAPCSICAYPLYQTNDKQQVCGYCIKKPPFFDKASIGYLFAEPLRGLMHQFKYQQGLHFTSFLGALILAAWKRRPTYPQCIYPVPLHPEKIKQRGFNQSALLAHYIGKKLDIPVDKTMLSKSINTKAQANLSQKERAKNLNNAFYVTKTKHQHVAVIDDLLTTGSTANEVALALKRTGVETVEIWCAARAVTSIKTF